MRCGFRPRWTFVLVTGCCGFLVGRAWAQTINNPNFEANNGGFAVATGWSSFGGAKWEGVWEAQRAWGQGTSDIAGNGGFCGVHQQVAVTSGTRYRLAAEARVTTTANEFSVQVGIDPSGSANPANATWGTASYATAWTTVSVEANASASTITIFLRTVNHDSTTRPWWGIFDNVSLVAVGPSATNTPTNTQPGVPTSTPTNTQPGVPTNTPSRTPTFPVGTDADGDGIGDSVECWPCSDDSRSNRWLADSDGDGRSDSQEDTNRNGLHDAGETFTRYADSDCDGLEDGMEVLMGTNPLLPTSGYTDADTDGLPDLYDPNNTDTDIDNDLYRDGYEAVLLGLASVTDPNLHPDLGDLNGDAQLSNVDSLIIQSIFLSLVNPASVATTQADTFRDGYITNADALLGQLAFLGMIDSIPKSGAPCPPPATPTPTGGVPTATRTPTPPPGTSTPTATPWAGDQPEYWDPRLDQLMTVWQAPNVPAGTVIWKLKSAVYENEFESGGTHSIFYKCLDFNGTQLSGVRIAMSWPGGSANALTKTPPDWGDIAMSGGNWCPFAPPQGPYTGYVDDGVPSYRVIGMGMPCNRHVNFKLTFQKAYAPGPPPTSTPTVTPGGPTMTPTATWTPANCWYQNNFEEYLSGQLGGKVVYIPQGSPGFIPLHDGGPWEPLDFNRNNTIKRNGQYAATLRVIGTQPNIRGCGLLAWWENDIKLPPNTRYTLSVWVKNNARPNDQDYVDVLLVHRTRTTGADFDFWNWDQRDRRFGRDATAEWTRLEITFNSGTASNRRDEIAVLLAGNPGAGQPDVTLYIDEMCMVQN